MSEQEKENIQRDDAAERAFEKWWNNTGDEIYVARRDQHEDLARSAFLAGVQWADSKTLVGQCGEGENALLITGFIKIVALHNGKQYTGTAVIAGQEPNLDILSLACSQAITKVQENWGVIEAPEGKAS